MRKAKNICQKAGTFKRSISQSSKYLMYRGLTFIHNYFDPAEIVYFCRIFSTLNLQSKFNRQKKQWPIAGNPLKRCLWTTRKGRSLYYRQDQYSFYWFCQILSCCATFYFAKKFILCFLSTSPTNSYWYALFQLPNDEHCWHPYAAVVQMT